jgi:ribosomal protein S18 acetylase RimI-like enzyme
MIRPARPTEAGTVRDIVHAAYRHYMPRVGKPPGPMLDDYARRIANHQAWVLEESDRILGILILEEHDGRFVLDNIAVAPDAQGGGRGRTLIAFAEAEARRRGYRDICLYTHVLMTENQALYQRLGFIETGRATENGFDRVYMAKTLA